MQQHSGVGSQLDVFYLKIAEILRDSGLSYREEAPMLV